MGLGGNLAPCPELVPRRLLQTASYLVSGDREEVYIDVFRCYLIAFLNDRGKRNPEVLKIKLISIIQLHSRIASLALFIIHEIKGESEVSIQEEPRVNAVNHLCLASSGLTSSMAGSSVCEPVACHPGVGWLWGQVEAQG